MEARGLERSRRPRRHKHGPVSPVFPEAAGRVKRQRGARRRRATIQLGNGGGSSTPWSETPGNSCISTWSIFRASERAAIRSLSSLRKMPGGFWRQMGSDPTNSGTASIITRDSVAQPATHLHGEQVGGVRDSSTTKFQGEIITRGVSWHCRRLSPGSPTPSGEKEWALEREIVI